MLQPTYPPKITKKNFLTPICALKNAFFQKKINMRPPLWSLEKFDLGGVCNKLQFGIDDNKWTLPLLIFLDFLILNQLCRPCISGCWIKTMSATVLFSTLTGSIQCLSLRSGSVSITSDSQQNWLMSQERFHKKWMEFSF